MLWLVLALSAAPLSLRGPLPPGRQTPATGPIDASTLKVAAPTTVAELDLGKLKGELRQLAWAPDGSKFYIQTADGNPQSPRLRHYWVAREGGAIMTVDAEPDWATAYWYFKSDRSAPGVGSLMIELDQKLESVKVGTGTGRPGEQATGNGNGGGIDIEKTAESQHQNVARLKLLDETISEFVNQMPIPGLMFGWGPMGSGAIVYTDREFGHLMFLDRNKHKQTVSGVKDALLPAWTTDGARLAWVQKSGRKKYTLMYADVGR